MGIDVWEVIGAAATKPFGFMPFYPGPGLGGHCIPIDPFYLTWKAREYDISTRFIELAGEINTAMPRYVVERLQAALDQHAGKGLKGARVLILGVAYKKNVDDTPREPALQDHGAARGQGRQHRSITIPIVSEIPRSREYPELAGRRSVALTAGDGARRRRGADLHRSRRRRLSRPGAALPAGDRYPQRLCPCRRDGRHGGQGVTRRGAGWRADRRGAVRRCCCVGWGVARRLWPANDPDRYSVVEGDTLAWRPPQCLLSMLGIACLPQRLRLYGVDAFERKQTCRDAKGKVWPCGAVATARLHQLVESGDFACHVDHEFIDRHAREFAVCTAHGEDVGAVLVSEGLAFAYGRGAQYLPYRSGGQASTAAAPGPAASSARNISAKAPTSSALSKRRAASRAALHQAEQAGDDRDRRPPARSRAEPTASTRRRAGPNRPPVPAVPRRHGRRGRPARAGRNAGDAPARSARRAARGGRA